VDVSQFGFNAYFYGQYQEVNENQKLTHTLYYTQDEEEFLARNLSADHHLIEIDFAEHEGKSWVRFSQYGTLPDGEAQQAQAGMESYFDNLGIYLTPR